MLCNIRIMHNIYMIIPDRFQIRNLPILWSDTFPTLIGLIYDQRTRGNTTHFIDCDGSSVSLYKQSFGWSPRPQFYLVDHIHYLVRVVRLKKTISVHIDSPKTPTKQKHINGGRWLVLIGWSILDCLDHILCLHVTHIFFIKVSLKK